MAVFLPRAGGVREYMSLYKTFSEMLTGLLHDVVAVPMTPEAAQIIYNKLNTLDLHIIRSGFVLLIKGVTDIYEIALFACTVVVLGLILQYL